MWTSILCLLSLVVYLDAQTAEQLAAVDTKVAAVQQEILKAMDECRMTVKPSASNMLKMEWSPDAAKTAEKYAKQCKFKHSEASERTIPAFTCGENLYMGSHFATWTQAIKAFCDEQKNFVYGKGKTSPNAVTEHFTQQAWATSFLAGCSAAYCATGEYRWFYVCHQCPFGNISPAVKPYKSGTPCGDCPKYCDNGLCTNSCKVKNKVTNCETYRGRCSDSRVQAACEGMCKCPNAIV
ncbi:cysteine-rich venom protein-like [Dendropsophus ebraccatus]|uniref:cysteine-rich venom protein-like n=1 Tax=Dendropsophus ebraccatus TaxID=150705 RepID=UPI0038313CDE